MEDIKNVTALEEQTIKRISNRIIPFLIILFIMAFLDRTNIGFAALHMNDALGITQTIFGLGAGVFFLGYFIAEVPSNILLHRFGARIWIARIMITWGIIAALMGFIHSGTQFIVLRFLLGIAEAGFFRCDLLFNLMVSCKISCPCFCNVLSWIANCSNYWSTNFSWPYAMG